MIACLEKIVSAPEYCNSYSFKISVGIKEIGKGKLIVLTRHPGQ